MLLALKYHSILLSFSPIIFPHRSLLCYNWYRISKLLSFCPLCHSLHLVQNTTKMVSLHLFWLLSLFLFIQSIFLFIVNHFHALLPVCTLGLCNQSCLHNPIHTQPIAFCCHQSTESNLLLINLKASQTLSNLSFLQWWQFYVCEVSEAG